MTKSLIKNTFREIRNSKSRFISIMAIIALGVGFFAGIKATTPSMYNLAENYYRTQNLMDFRIVSTVGFDEDDIESVECLDDVVSVMPSYFCDVMKTAESGGDVVRIISLPVSYNGNEKLNEVVVKEGRLPEKPGEIVVEASSMNSSGYDIGDTVKLSESAGDTDVSEELKTLEYTVVGKVESPLYISYQRGVTNVGDGKIDEFMYIMPEDFAFERFTELYVQTTACQSYSAFSDDYDNRIEQLTQVFEVTENVRCEVFNTDVIGKAEQELEDSEKEYADSKAETEDKLASASEEIESGKAELEEKINEARQELEDAYSEIESASEEFESAKTEFNEKISDAEEEISANRAKLDIAKSDYENAKAEFEEKIFSAQAELDAAESEYQTAYEDFKNNSESELIEGIAQAQASVDAFEAMAENAANDEELETINAQLAAAEAALDELNGTYSEAVSSLEQSRQQLDDSKSELESEKESGQAQLDEAKKQIEDGEKALNSAVSELESEKESGQAQLDEAEKQIKSAKEEYNSGVCELEELEEKGQRELDDVQSEYESKKAEAEEEFAKAEQKIKDAREELNNINSPDWYIYTRADNPGYSTFSQNADRLDAVATVFPVFFLLVAVLVCVTTMTRLIEEKRTEIGTLKALGYGNFSIIMKFVIYALIAGVSGCIVGTAAGVTTLPFIIYNAYKIMYYIGDITLVLNIPSIILGVAAAVVCTTVVSVIVCCRSLRQKPAAIMRPKSPKKGKRILLEHISPLWSRMNFTSKLTSRNLFRYKSRLCMTVIGVAGCTALIVAAFGLLDSFDPLTDTQFGKIYKYDAVIVPSDSGTSDELKDLADEIGSNDDVNGCMLAFQEEANVEYNSELKDSGTYVEVVENSRNFSSMLSLHTRKGGEELELSDNGVLVNEKLAEEMGFSVGDSIAIDSDSGRAEVVVDGIFEQYIYNYVYMTPKLYKSLYGKDVEYNMLNVDLTDVSDSAKSEFGSTCLKNDKVAAVSYVNESVDEFCNMLDSLNMVVMVMIICAASLALVVLYNLTNINLAERMREIATFKVLGFYNRETSLFIYLENIVLTIMGIIAGLLLGTFLTEFIVSTVEVDNVMFGRDIYATSYIYAAVLTLAFAILVNFTVSFKIKAVNMVESLKSVE